MINHVCTYHILHVPGILYIHALIHNYIDFQNINIDKNVVPQKLQSAISYNPFLSCVVEHKKRHE